MKDLDTKQIKRFVIAGGALLLLAALLWNRSALVKVLSITLNAILPLIFGCIIAFVLNIPLTFYERHLQKVPFKVRRTLSIILSILTVVLIFGLVGVLVIPEFLSSIKTFFSSVQIAIHDLQLWLTENQETYPIIKKVIDEGNIRIEDLDNIFNIKINEFVPVLIGNAFSIIASTVSWITTFGFGFIFSIYVLSCKEILKENFQTFFSVYLKKEKYERLMHIFSLIHYNFSHFITGQCLDAIILGSLCALGMFILRLPSYAMIGALIGVAALIPIVGSLLGALIAAFILFMQNPINALVFLIFLVILQRFDGDFIYPKVVGQSIGLPAFWVFTAVTVGGALNGIIGMLIAVPAFSVCYTLVKENMEKRMKNKEMEESEAK